MGGKARAFRSVRVWSIIYLSIFGLFIYSNAQTTREIVKDIWDYSPPRHKYEFIWNLPHTPFLRELREQYSLDTLIQNCNSDLERAITICEWVHNRWNHATTANPQPPDPIKILKAAEEGASFGCWEYSVVTASSLISLGIPARIVDLFSPNAVNTLQGGVHIVVEAFLPDVKRWVMIDSQWNVVAKVKNLPLNIAEFKVVMEKGGKGVNLYPLPDSLIAEYWNWIRPYLGYLGTYIDQRFDRQPFKRFQDQYLVLKPLESPSLTKIQGRKIQGLINTSSLAEFYPTPSIPFFKDSQ